MKNLRIVCSAKYMKFKILFFIEEIKNKLDKIPMNIAYIVPPKLALWCFIRVVSLRGDCPDWYKQTYDSFLLKHNIKRM